MATKKPADYPIVQHPDSPLPPKGREIEDIDYFELNEAFAAQSLACVRQLNIPEEKVLTPPHWYNSESLLKIGGHATA